MKEKIRELLLSTNRPGMLELADELENTGFYESPASTRFHGSYKGGLAEHSFRVYELFKAQVEKLNLNLQEGISEESIIICALLHDMCKVGLYFGPGPVYKFNPSQGSKGHAKLSIEMIEKHMSLTDQERVIIMFHMGFFGTKEFKARSGEYSLNELLVAGNNEKLVKLFHWCDDEESTFEKKGGE